MARPSSLWRGPRRSDEALARPLSDEALVRRGPHLVDEALARPSRGPLEALVGEGLAANDRIMTKQLSGKDFARKQSVLTSRVCWQSLVSNEQHGVRNDANKYTEH
jgi:hypothetical protein